MKPVEAAAHESHRAFLNRYYRQIRYVYDPSRKFFLFGRDRAIASLLAEPWQSLVEIGPGTGRNLSALHSKRPGAVAVVGSFLLAALSGFPAGFYGLKWGWLKRSLTHAFMSVLALSAAGLAALTIFQALGRLPASLPLFETSIPPEMLAYVLLSAPLQEFVFRGVFQSSIRYILGRRRGAVPLAISFSTLAYAASHLPWGLDTALFMIVPGLVWGWQYERDRTLLGVVLAHMAIGYLFVAATPLWTVLVG